MKNILLLLTLSVSLIGCDMLHKADKAMDAVQATGPKMDETNANMNKMKHDQCLALTIDGLSKAEYQDMVNPIAFKVAPWAKGFAECAELKDLVEFSELQLLSVDDGTFRKEVDNSGKEYPYSVQDKVKMNNQKLVIISGLSQIAGQLPAPLVEQLIEEARNGASSHTAIKLLMLRYSFVKDFQFDSARMGKTFTNVAMAEKAFAELEKADFIARLDRKGELSFVTKGLVKVTENSEDPNIVIQIDHDELKGQWRRLLRKIDADQPVAKLELGQNEAQLNAQRAASAQKLSELKAKVQEKIDYWN